MKLFLIFLPELFEFHKTPPTILQPPLCKTIIYSIANDTVLSPCYYHWFPCHFNHEFHEFLLCKRTSSSDIFSATVIFQSSLMKCMGCQGSYCGSSALPEWIFLSIQAMLRARVRMVCIPSVSRLA